MSVLELSYQALCGFLILAKQNTYAKDAPKAISKCLLSKNYVFEHGDFRYEDQYFGEHVDVGEEIIWYQGVPIWGMGYRGGIHRAFIDEREKAFGFLRQALSAPDPDFPIRGPKKFQDSVYQYENFPEGNIFDFTGRETISKGDVEICYRRYVGGLIYGKNNCDMQII